MPLVDDFQYEVQLPAYPWSLSTRVATHIVDDETLQPLRDKVEHFVYTETDKIEKHVVQVGAFGGNDDLVTEYEHDPVHDELVEVTKPDGTVEWATILLTNGEENEDGELQTWEVLIDGRTGNVAWRRTRTEAEHEEAIARAEEEKEERKIVRGREAGAR